LVERAAGMILAAGATSGDRVMIVKQPNFDVPLLAFACARVGVVPELIHPTVGPDNLAVLIERAAPVAIVTDQRSESDGLFATVTGSVPRWQIGSAGPTGFAQFDRGRVELPARPVLANSTPQLVTHTSGTTGVPKLVLQTATTFDGQCRPQAVIGRLLRVRDPYLICISPVHVRTMAAIVSTFVIGVPLGFMTQPDPATAARMLERVRPGAVETVPNAFIRWEELTDDRPELFESVRIYLSTFDAAHPRTIDTLLAKGRRKARYIQVYGQSETGPVAMKFYRAKRSILGRFRKPCEHSRCVGRALPGQSKIRIDAPGQHGREVPGAILAKSSATTPAYLGSPDQRVDGWWAMGDYGAISERGCLHLYDRLVDRDADVDSLLALEDRILERIPQLTEAVLIPMDRGLPVPLICTRQDAPLDERLWWQAVADLPDLASPVHCRWEDIPHTATWKVRRPEAARLLASADLPVLAVSNLREAGTS
ncbi:MAG: AMP-binding protein, partial [Actinomycetota bacterium]|nr:AMP-binding protein [Actinomycetota bacterium]